MKDFKGTEIVVGDSVVFITKLDNGSNGDLTGLVEGSVLKIGAKTITVTKKVRHHYKTMTGRVPAKTLTRKSYQFIKI
jgi:hypothetical protein